MTVYHVVLFKLKPNVSKTTLTEWAAQGAAMVGKIPGLIKFDANTPLPATAHRTQGYEMGVVAILEKPEDIPVYADHPAHLEIAKLGREFSTETLAYDLEF
ncbi:hypothetical protein F5Y19DRAFT_447934 [Xylariaceae sp. FL1651]|nr:hypothetical protein F5Y19DRAFT_447934 [Xylariaceae sp. FL1651]